MKVQTMWWCATCRQRVHRPLWKNASQPDRWAYHLTAGGWGHGLEAAPMIEGELVGARV